MPSAILYGCRMSLTIGLAAIVLSVNLLGGWPRDALNPRRC